MTAKLSKFKDLLDICSEKQCSIGQVALFYELERGEQTEQQVNERVLGFLQQMKETIHQGLYSEEKSLSGLSGGMSKKVMAYLDSGQAFLSSTELKMMAYALATLEENSRMHKIVACPTAGGSGVVPGVLLAVAEDRNIPIEKLVYPLLSAGMVGEIVSRRMYLSGSAAGCQAEVGVATGMAAAAIVEAVGGTPQQALHATAIALKNMMGLVCDPVAGLVEVPCVKRNAVGATHAATAASLALAGIESFVPPDEVVDAMAKVGQMMSPKLKESAEGGLAKSPTAVSFTEKLKQQQDKN